MQNVGEVEQALDRPDGAAAPVVHFRSDRSEGSDHRADQGGFTGLWWRVDRAVVEG